MRNSGNSINVFREIYGDGNLLLALNLKIKTANYSPKQKMLIEKYKNKEHQIPSIVSEHQRNKVENEKQD